jgi:hypothetical protein
MNKTHSQILVVSWNELLLQTRRLILGTYFEVDGAGKLSEAADRLRTTSFDLVVLCDTLSDSECMQIFEYARGLSHKPEILLLLAPNQERPREIIGHILPFMFGPMDLLYECADILRVEVRAKQRSCYLPSEVRSRFEIDLSVGSGKQHA